MMKIALIFGGSGYIGSNLLRHFISENAFDKYYIFDIKTSSYIEQNGDDHRLFYNYVDVRHYIDFHLEPCDIENSWIFNLAAIHREPGHDNKEYFDTNILGAQNINAFARHIGIINMFFTSSIAPYGRSLDERTENSNLYPETAYGVSKAMCELIHQNWLNESSERRLIIVRPSVIYGPKDPGNVFRMINSLKKGTFVLPNGGRVIKSYGYIYGLIESIAFVMSQKKPLIIYNYAENPLMPLNEMAKVVKTQLEIRKPTIKLPVEALALVAGVFQLVFKVLGKKSDIHPVRVRKAGFPTNIRPQYLIDNGFEFKYGFQKSLIHWKHVSPEDFK